MAQPKDVAVSQEGSFLSSVPLVLLMRDSLLLPTIHLVDSFLLSRSYNVFCTLV